MDSKLLALREWVKVLEERVKVLEVKIKEALEDGVQKQ